MSILIFLLLLSCLLQQTRCLLTIAPLWWKHNTHHEYPSPQGANKHESLPIYRQIMKGEKCSEIDQSRFPSDVPSVLNMYLLWCWVYLISSWFLLYSSNISMVYHAVTLRNSCLPVLAWRRVVLRFFDQKQLLLVSYFRWCYFTK